MFYIKKPNFAGKYWVIRCAHVTSLSFFFIVQTGSGYQGNCNPVPNTGNAANHQFGSHLQWSQVEIRQLRGQPLPLHQPFASRGDVRHTASQCWSISQMPLHHRRTPTEE